MKVRSSPYTNSVQILYESFGDLDRWSVYFGPQGQPADPCTVLPFSRFYPAGNIVGPDRNIHNPGFPQAQTWAVLPDLYKDTPCLIICDGKGPPLLQCAQLLLDEVILMIDFERDPQYDDEIIECADGTKYHRGYYAEYSA